MAAATVIDQDARMIGAATPRNDSCYSIARPLLNEAQERLIHKAVGCNVCPLRSRLI